MKLCISTFFVIVSLTALVSCDLLWAPMSGRWNPNDPKAELKSVSQTFQPTIDGYLGSLLTWNDFSVEINAKSDEYCLLEFDLSDLPDTVSSAELQLYCSALAVGDSNVSAHVILKPWDPATVNWSTVSSSGFFDPTPITSTYVDTPGVIYSWFLDDAVTHLEYGILLMGDDADEVRFSSSETTTNPLPAIIVEGYTKL